MMMSITKNIQHQSCTNEYESLVTWYWRGKTTTNGGKYNSPSSTLTTRNPMRTGLGLNWSLHTYSW